MYSGFGRRFASGFAYFPFRLFNNQLFMKKCLEVSLKSALVYMPYTMINQNNIHCINFNMPLKTQQPEKQHFNIQLSQDQVQWIEWLKKFISNATRIIQLLYIFLPSICMLPLRFFKSTKHLWMNSFVSAIERAGVVWIKIFQYMSHRRDIIGPQMAEAFSHLRENAPTHSFEETKRIIRKEYGKEIHQVFEEFSMFPIASGSVSQVYKGKFHGRKVAVKVRHPGVDVHIDRDVDLLFFMSKIGSFFSKSLIIPVGQESMKKTLIDQIDFNVEKDNLANFNRMFHKNKYVRFPRVFESQTKESILIETFVQGVPISDFIQNRHPLNQVMARLGSKTFFQMLMINNFIHADCHSGNLLVELKKHDSSFYSEVKDYIAQYLRKFEQFFIEKGIKQEQLKEIYRGSKRDEANMRKILRKSNQQLKLKIIDAGMVLVMNKKDKQNFVEFLQCVVQSEGLICAERIYSLSNYNGKKIKKGQHKKYFEQLQGCFGKLNNIKIDDLEGMKLLLEMLDIIREYNMKLDGQFATLLTNIVVMEGIARDLDPNINILKCAIPYFQNKNHELGNKIEQNFLTAL